MRRGLLACLLIVLAAPAWAGSYTVTTTGAQDRALAARAARLGITAGEVGGAHGLSGLVTPALAEHRQARERASREALDALAPAARARALHDLGVNERVAPTAGSSRAGAGAVGCSCWSRSSWSGAPP